MYVVCLLHVSATLVANLREVHYKGYIKNTSEQMYRCKILIFKVCGFEYVWKYEIQIKSA